MKKLLKIFIALILAFVLFINLSPITASAATNTELSTQTAWHKGTPKELRGYYMWTRDFKHPLSGKYNWVSWNFKKNTAEMGQMNWPMFLCYKIRYRKLLNGRYELKFNVRHNSYILAEKNTKFYFGKIGKKIKQYNNSSSDKGMLFHKVKLA